jgi:hypothetical protein
MKSFKRFMMESKMGRELSDSIGSAAENKPYMYTTADFHSGNSPFHVQKIGNPVKFKISDGTHKVKSLEHDEEVTVPKGHVIVSRPNIKGDKPYFMPPNKFEELHDGIDYEKGTATQRGVTKEAFKAPHDGIFHPPWSKVPLHVKKGDTIIKNGDNPRDVAAIAPDVYKQTYREIKK